MISQAEYAFFYTYMASTCNALRISEQDMTGIMGEIKITMNYYLKFFLFKFMMLKVCTTMNKNHKNESWGFLPQCGKIL
jgi:hypothetical protein